MECSSLFLRTWALWQKICTYMYFFGLKRELSAWKRLRIHFYSLKFICSFILVFIFVINSTYFATSSVSSYTFAQFRRTGLRRVSSKPLISNSRMGKSWRMSERSAALLHDRQKDGGKGRARDRREKMQDSVHPDRRETRHWLYWCSKVYTDKRPMEYRPPGARLET